MDGTGNGAGIRMDEMSWRDLDCIGFCETASAFWVVREPTIDDRLDDGWCMQLLRLPLPLSL